MMETIKFKNKDLAIIEKFKNNKILVKYKNKNYVIVPFNSYNDFSDYVEKKKILKKNKLEMSKLKKVDKKSFLVLEEYIDGEIATKLISDGSIEEKHFVELFRIYRNMRFAKIALNYKPENFIYHKKTFYYLASEAANYKSVTPFEKSDDIFLWMPTKNQKEYCINKGYEYKDRPLYKEGGELNKQLALFCVKYW